MPYAVMQKTLEPPTVEQLKSAFRGIPGLTSMDAYTLGKDAFGILVKHFPLGRASALQKSLAAHGVETEVVEEASLPAMPPGRHVNCLACTPEALMVSDPLGRSFPLEWKNILLIAAGKVPVVEFKQSQTANYVPQNSSVSPVMDTIIHDPFFGLGIPNARATPATSVDFRTKESRPERLLLEVVISRGALRYSVEADKAAPQLFQYLGERRTGDLVKNFSLLIQDLTSHAPEAAINRGAYYLRENAPEPLAYPSKNAFYEEIIWLLWQLARNESATG